MTMYANALGMLYLVEFGGCDPKAISDAAGVRSLMLEAAEKMKASIVNDLFHAFNPHGVSGVVVISQSHVAIHTWPEHCCASIDIFTCSNGLDISSAIERLKRGFSAKSVTVIEMKRGVADK